MRPESENEMEQIQKGLESFLDNEVEGIKKESIADEYWDDEKDEPASECWDDEKDEPAGECWDDEKDESAGEYWDDEDYESEDNDTGKKPYRQESNRTQRGKASAGASVSDKPVKKKRKKKSRLVRFVIKLAVILAVLFAGLYLLVGLVYPKMTYQESTVLADGGLKEDGVTSVLLIGSDSRTEGNDGRSDAMILLTISDKTRTIHMTSLLRDMYVEIPGHDGNRLNAAYAYGGPELLLETIRHNFGIEVYRYAVVNFSAFAGLVDAVEGVDIELSNEEVQWINAYLNEYNELRGMPMETDYLDTSLSGELRLNGAQALAYSRNRYIGSDFGRTERQRKVLSAVMQKLPAAVVKNPRQLVNGLFPNLTTNLTQLECTRLCTMVPKLAIYDTVQDSIPLDGTYSNATIREMSVLEVDFEKNRTYIETEIYGK